MAQVESKPEVSVCVITYNHARYIRQCLQSIVDQKAPFAFEVIVGDDCSTDGTRAIVREFAAKYPGLIKPILHERNVGGTRNYLAVHGAASGRYIAHIDGDDYMLAGKLQAQANALDANPDCTMCVHEVKRFDDRNKRYVKRQPQRVPRKSDVRYLLMNLPFFAHSSKMYRREFNKGLESMTGEALDCYFHVHHALAGRILHLPAVLGVYRLNVGHSTDQSDTRKTLYKAPSVALSELYLDALEHARAGGVDATLIAKAKAKVLFDYSYAQLMAHDFPAFHSYITRSLETARINTEQVAFGMLADAPWILYALMRLRAGVRSLLANFGVGRLFRRAGYALNAVVSALLK